jgi:uncharacterized MAPEG superfamily protein
MNSTLFALAGFAAWTLLLTFILLNLRGYYAFLSKNKIALNKFSPDGSDVQGFGQRLTRAHLNCIEMLPSFCAIVIVASLSNQIDMMESTVMYVLYARILQSVVHLMSTSVIAVVLRASLWGAQLALLLFYSYKLFEVYL